MPTTLKSILALDVGQKRIGLAVANSISMLPQPFTTLEHNENFLSELKNIIELENISDIVIGLPRNLSGDETNQTKLIKKFAEQLKDLSLSIHWQDESVTSAKAEEELKRRAKPYKKSDIDALAATYILEDWLKQHKDNA